MIASFFAFVGHCYPLFAGFKGGKGVACSAGIVLAVSLTSWSYFLKQFVIPMAVFVVVVLVTRYVSLGSMTAYILAAVMAWIWQPDRLTDVVLTLMCVLVILKHHENIDRLIHHRENKISFAKTKSE
jgi:glycerol-3-phosphate acyltransferase PlsY